MRWSVLALILFASISTGCAAVAPIRPPLARIPTQRPAIVDEQRRLTDAGIVWLGQLVESYRLNCVALSVLRGEDARQCDEGLR